MNLDSADAIAIASAVKSGEVSAVEVTEGALRRIADRDKDFNCFTEVIASSALEDAKAVDRQIENGEDPGLLAGVPFAVKNLYDIAGITTIAGSKINGENSAASEDATAVARLKKAGAILVGALNMDEYAYGFVTENTHYGATRNPHDVTRVAGGSSGGSAAAVAGGLVPLTLGSDTNGSIRVPASLCGVFGLKPTYGRLSRSGVALFSSSFDHVGHFARSLRDIAAAFDVMQGEDKKDPVCTKRSPVKTLDKIDVQGINDLKIAIAKGGCRTIADDYFTKKAVPEVLEAVEKVSNTLSVNNYVKIPEAHRARAAAYIITASEGANLHLDRLRSRPQDFDPETRDRFIAGALIPSSWYIQAQRFRSWYKNQVREIFTNVDVIIAPTTPIPAPKIGQKTMILDGEEILVRPHLGLFTQPLSFIGLPVLSVPVHQPDTLPVGVQLIAAPYNEVAIFRVAKVLGEKGIVSAPIT